MKSPSGKFIVMGTGASAGVPVIGCPCPVCTSSNPKNKRLRTSCLIEIGQKRLIIDPGPDYREQALVHKIDALNGAIITHTHYDHIGGLDELRLYNFRQKQAIPCLMSRESFKELKRRYDYIFKDSPSVSVAVEVAFLEDDMGSQEFLGIPVAYCSYTQVGMKVNGIRLGNLAFVSDIKEYDKEKLLNFLEGVETLILGAIRDNPSSAAHLTFGEAISLIKETKAKKSYLTHLSHDVEYQAESLKLPPGVFIAYDGLTLDFTL